MPYFAVAYGHKRGIFESFEETRNQTRGFTHSVWKRFDDRSDAEDYLEANTPVSTSLHVDKSGNKFFSVPRGKTIGIFTTYNKVRASGVGFPARLYKKFSTYNEAKDYFDKFSPMESVDGGLAAAAALPIGENSAASTPMKDAKKPKVEQKIGKQEEKTHVKLIEKSNKENVKDIEPEEGQAGETSAALSAAPMTKPVARKRVHYEVDSDESDGEAHDIPQKRRQDEKSDDEYTIQEAEFLDEAFPESAKISAEEKPKERDSMTPSKTADQSINLSDSEEKTEEAVPMPTTSSDERRSKPESSFESDCAPFTVPEEVYRKALPWLYKSEAEKAGPSDSISYESRKEVEESEV